MILDDPWRRSNWHFLALTLLLEIWKEDRGANFNYGCSASRKDRFLSHDGSLLDPLAIAQPACKGRRRLRPTWETARSRRAIGRYRMSRNQMSGGITFAPRQCQSRCSGKTNPVLPDRWSKSSSSLRPHVGMRFTRPGPPPVSLRESSRASARIVGDNKYASRVYAAARNWKGSKWL